MAQAIIERSCKKLGSAIAAGDEAAMTPSDRAKLEKIVAAMGEIQPVLEDAEWMPVQFARNWLTEVRHAGYAVSDLVDELQDTRVPATGTATVSNNSPRITVDKVEAVEQQVMKIHSEFKRLGFSRLERPKPEVVEAAPAIVGRDGDKQRIMDVLSASNLAMTILPIFGLPAIGKTALARTIFHDTRLQDEYNHRVWLNVPGKVGLSEIGSSIICQVSSERQDPQIGHESVRQRLQELFHGKKVLVVLDDLWDDESVQLASLMSMLTFGEKVTVIVTTREKDIADKFCTVEPQRLDPLSDDTCWAIIKAESLLEKKPPEEQENRAQLAKEIIKKCGGVPVTAQVVGRLLRHEDVQGWEEVKKGVTWSRFPGALELGYRRMTPYLRLCFSYCGIFPRGHDIAKDDLIRQWIALDLIEPSEEFSATQLAGKYFEMLLGMSFLHPAKSDSVPQRRKLEHRKAS